MKMGEYIKKLREEKEYSQDYLGSLLKPPVNRAAINKWETGKVENIKRNHIEQLSKIFNVSPCELMCWNDKFNENNKLTNEVKVYEEVQKTFGKNVPKIISNFIKLNEVGQEKAMEDVEILTELPKYTEKEKTKIKDA